MSDTPQDPLVKAATDAWRAGERMRKRHVRGFVRLLKLGATLWFASVAIIVALIATGHLFGPTGSEGWLLTPALLFATWAAILYAFRPRRQRPTELAVQKLPELLQGMEEWLDLQRALLPRAAVGSLETITQRLQALSAQVRERSEARSGEAELRRLVGEELPELVYGYQRVPVAFRTQPRHGGVSPDRQLVDGLATIDAALQRLHEQIAADDLHALATQQRYLEAKYKSDEPIK